MELSSQLVLRTFVTIAVSALVLGFFNIHWLTRLRLVIVTALGAAILGLTALPLIKPAAPLGAVTIFTGDITFVDAITCVILAYLAGFIAYFAAIPQGRQIAPLAAPAGLAVWALASGDMASLLRINHTIDQRRQLYAVMKWEAFFWLAILAAGYCGVLTAEKLHAKKPLPTETPKNSKAGPGKILSIATAVILTIVVAQLAISLFAQDVKMADPELGFVVGQPATTQIAFAVVLAFAITAFLAKKFLNVSYIFCTIAAVGVSVFAVMICAKEDVMVHMAENWPVQIFTRSICAVLPIQMVTFAAFGSIAGYWIALKWTGWSHHTEEIAP